MKTWQRSLGSPLCAWYWKRSALGLVGLSLILSVESYQGKIKLVVRHDCKICSWEAQIVCVPWYRWIVHDLTMTSLRWEWRQDIWNIQPSQWLGWVLVMQSLYMFLEPPLGVSKGVWSEDKCCVSKWWPTFGYQQIIRISVCNWKALNDLHLWE